MSALKDMLDGCYTVKSGIYTVDLDGFIGTGKSLNQAYENACAARSKAN